MEVKVIKYHFSDELEQYCRLSLFQIRRLPVSCRILLQKMGLYQDMVQEAYVLALEASKKGLAVPKEASNYAQRGLYRFLKNYGFVRDKQSYVPKVIAKSFLGEV